MPTCPAKGTKAPSGKGGSKGTKAPTDPLCDGKGGSKGTKAPTIGGTKGTKAPTIGETKGTKAPTIGETKGTKAPTIGETKGTKAPTTGGTKGTKAPSAGKGKGGSKGSPSSDTMPEPAGERDPVADTTEEDPNVFYVSESNANQQGLSTQAMVGTAFAVLLTLVLCVNLAFLWLFCRAKKNGGGIGGGDPYGTKVTVQHLKGGRVLVKKTIPLEDGTQVVQKTVYPDRETAAGHGFVPDLY
jgi:hypothetical protein